MAAIDTILAIFDLQVICCFLPNFKSIGLLVQEKKVKNWFSRWWPSWISDQYDFIYFRSTSPWCFLPSFNSIGLSGQEKKWKINFQDGGHLGFPTRIILSFFDLQVTQMLPTEFQVNWLFGSGEEAKNRFSRWRPSGISDQNSFSYLWSTSHPDASYKVSSQLAFQFRRRSKKWIFKMAAINTMLPTKFQVNWPFGSGERGEK